MSVQPKDVEIKFHPDAEFRFFIHDPEGDTFLCFRTAQDRDSHAQRVIDQYLDDHWAEEVTGVFCGEATHFAVEVERVDRTPENEDEHAFNGADYVCNYKALPASSPVERP